jgi:cation diffusion facilitator family transporter
MNPPPQLPHRRSRIALRRAAEGEGVRTVVVALAANLIIATAKLIAGMASRSTGMLAEAAHSAADSINEVLLGISLHRASRPADATHPLGHARERFLWAFMAAIASFLIGGCFSIFMAVRELEHRHPVEGTIAAWIVLGVAFLADGASLLQSIRQARRQATEFGLTFWSYLVRSSDPVVRAIVVEDGAALLGILLAAGGLLVSGWTRSNVPDAIASLLIGILLAVTAFGLARPLADFLVGRSMPAEQVAELHALFAATPAVEELQSLRAFYTGPEEVLVVAKVHPSPSLNTEELASAMDQLDGTIRSQFPLVSDVFIDMTTHRTSPAGADGQENG